MHINESNPPQLVLAGSLSIDHILQYGGSLSEQLQSAPLESLSLSVLLSGVTNSEGGIAGNIAYSSALLGEQPILFGSIGDDQPSYLAKLTKMGVQTDQTHISKLPTASFTVITDAKSCQIGGFHPGAMTDSESLSLEKFIDQNVLIVLSAHDPAQMQRHIEQAAKYKLRLVFDIGQQIAALSTEVVLAGLRTAELLLVNEYELELVLQRAAITKAELLDMVPLVVVTLGKEGCQIYQQGKELRVKAVTAKMVDPTGAGDAFRAGFFYGYVRNWPLTLSAQLGATVAAFAVETSGTQQHVFTRAQLDQRYKKQYQGIINWT